MGEKVEGIRSMNGRYNIDRGRLRIVQEMEKRKNLYVQPMDMNYRGGGGRDAGGRRGIRVEGNKGEQKKMGQL